MEGLIRIAKSTFSDFNIIEQDTAHSVLSDRQAVRLVATVTFPTPSGPTSGKAMLIYTVIGDKMYGISFGGKDYDTYFLLVEQMVEFSNLSKHPSTRNTSVRLLVFRSPLIMILNVEYIDQL